VEFGVPEFAPGTQATLTAHANGTTRSIPFEISPKRKWTVFVVPNEHLDVGYTDYASKVAEIQSRTIDQAMEMIEKHPEFRFTLDGFWIVEEFLAGRSAAQQQRFVEHVKQRKIMVPAVYGSIFTGFAGLENLIRSLYPSKRFAVEHQTDFDLALITDVPSYSWSYASVLAAAGIKYFVAASDAYRAPFLLYNKFHEHSPQWWQGPDGAKVLTWYSRHYHQLASLFGLPPQIVSGRDSLPRFLQAYDRPDYNSDAVILYGSQVENSDLNPQQASLVEQWNRVYAYPKLRFAGFAEAMDYIASQTGQSIPVVRGDGGPYWEDGLGANAAITALARENMQRVLTAEKFASIASLVDPAVRPDEKTLQSCWRNLLLIDEHTWQADSSVRDPSSQQSLRQGELKDSRAFEAKRQIDHQLGRSMAAIANAIHISSGSLVVFNGLNWPRSDLVEADVKKGFELVDLKTGLIAPTEILYSGNSFHHARFLAAEVPAVGYKCFALRASARPSQRPAISVETALENNFYRIALDIERGSVRSIFDKELQRELVSDAGPHSFNQYLYVTGADQLPNRLVQYSTVSPLPELSIRSAGNGRLISLRKETFGIVARLESSCANTPRIETEIILFNEQKKIEFINRVQKDKVYTKEGVYFVFPFNFEQPRFSYAIQNGYVDPAKDLLPGAGREWFTVQNWVAVDKDDVVCAPVPVDAPLVTIGDIARGSWPSRALEQCRPHGGRFGLARRSPDLHALRRRQHRFHVLRRNLGNVVDAVGNGFHVALFLRLARLRSVMLGALLQAGLPISRFIDLHQEYTDRPCMNG
jgi:hypothetical protein